MTAPLPAAPRRYTPGCLLLMVGAVWLLVYGGWMLWTLYSQLKDIRTFADTEPKLVTPAQPAGEQIAGLRNRINAFGAAVGGGRKAELRLSADDLNTLLASEEAASSMKENAKVEGIDDALHVRISVAINGNPLTGERLYINGLADVTAEADKTSGIKLKTKNLTVPGKKVSEGFLNHYKENSHLDTLLMDDARKSKNTAVFEVMKKLTTVRLEPGTAILEYVP